LKSTKGLQQAKRAGEVVMKHHEIIMASRVTDSDSELEPRHSCMGTAAAQSSPAPQRAAVGCEQDYYEPPSGHGSRAHYTNQSRAAIEARNINMTESESTCACLGHTVTCAPSPCWAALKSMLVRDNVRAPMPMPPSRHYMRYLQHTKISPTR
jgi:hypothetical protein